MHNEWTTLLRMIQQDKIQSLVEMIEMTAVWLKLIGEANHKWHDISWNLSIHAWPNTRSHEHAFVIVLITGFIHPKEGFDAPTWCPNKNKHELRWFSRCTITIIRSWYVWCLKRTWRSNEHAFFIDYSIHTRDDEIDSSTGCPKKKS